MVSERKVRKVLRSALKNPYYRETYENAPTNGSRRYWQMTFCTSAATRNEVDGKFGEECREELSNVEKKLTLEDWEHLYEYCGTHMFKAACNAR